MANSRKLRFWTCMVLASCFVMAGSSFAGPYEVPFHSGTIVPPAGQFEIPATRAVNGRVHVLVQMNDYLHRGQRESLADAGLTLLSYLPDRAYVASVSVNAKASDLAGLGVRSITPMRAEYKLHPRCLDKSFGPWSEFTAGRRIFAVEVMPDVKLDDAAAALKQIGCEIGYRYAVAHAMLVALDPERVVEIADLDGVLFVNEETPPMGPMNNVVRQRLKVDSVQNAPYSLNGDSVTVMVYDAGLVDDTHPDFGTRVTWLETGTAADHATHVAGTLGGDGTNSTNHQYRGMAPAVRIISGLYNGPAAGNPIFYDQPADFAPDFSLAMRTYRIEESTSSIGINIELNQYSCTWFGDYELSARTLDSLCISTEGYPLILYFAAGNDRGGTRCAQNYSSMSVPATAKNVITVGATGATDAVAAWSCAGPTDDGRLKPEICADGVGVHSTVVGGGYATYDGTSMATPAVAGVGALILQEWHRLHPGVPDLLPETMKAILINSATQIGTTAGPRYLYGYGVANALKGVKCLLAGGVLESSLEIDEEFTHTFAVTDSTVALDVSLAWSDPPATGNVIPTLINDLDLRLEDPNGTMRMPWKLRPNGPTQPAITGRDSLNNCERVHVNNPAVGTWTIHVNGAINGGNSQTFALASNLPLMTDWATLSGQIRNSANEGVPAILSVIGQTRPLYTDSTGNFLILLPGAGTYSVHAFAYGYLATDSTVTITDGTRDLNIMLPTAQSGTVNGVVQNQFGIPYVGAMVEFMYPRVDTTRTATNPAGDYSVTLPGGATYSELVTIANIGTMRATVTVPENGTVTQDFTIETPGPEPCGPDSFGYRAYETTDSGYHATYDWLEISPRVGGEGTLIQGAQPPANDWVATVNMPFPFRFYGQTDTILRVSADGWIGVGAAIAGQPDNGKPYRNVAIPTDTVPNGMICLFWDDLYPYQGNRPDSGDIESFYDSDNGRFIIEYHNVPHFKPRRHQTTGQLIIWDQQTRPTPTGDNEFQIQFQSVVYSDSMRTGDSADADATIGIENRRGSDGIQVVMDGIYDRHAMQQIVDGYAILFTTGPWGTVEGQIVTVPSMADYSTFDLRMGNRTTRPDAAGDYRLDTVAIGTYRMVVTRAGYEADSSRQFTVRKDSTVTLDYMLYRLDPARNLRGEYVPDPPNVAQLRLTWQPPSWAPTANERRPGGDHGALDALTGYEVWQPGSTAPLATVTDTTYTYHVTTNGDYEFYVKTIYAGGISDSTGHFRISIDLGAGEKDRLTPTEFYLMQNYPNPFNPSTQIEYGLPKAAKVKLEVYNVLGQKVATLVDGLQNAGVYHMVFSAEGLGSGIYYCRLHTNEFEKVQKMLLMR
jgi:hypothetical protein